MKESNFDVIVVGARVAGASTAMLLARAGHRVAFVDRARFPSDTLSTHGLWHTGVLQLRRWGLLDRLIAGGAPPSREICLTVDGMAAPIPVPRAGGIDTLYAPRRTELDPMLVEAAEAAGAAFFDRSRVTGVTRSAAGRVDGVTMLDPERNEVKLAARFVVGADGWRSSIARAVGAREYDALPATNACHYSYWEGLDSRGYEIWMRTTGVMAGVFPTHGGSCVYVNCRTDRTDDLRTDLASGYLRFLEEAAPDLAARLRTAKRRTRVYGTRGQPNFKRTPFGPGWALVGDAGYTKDPVSGHGITDALRDAELLARALHGVLSEGAEEQEALRHYQAERDRLSHTIYARTCDLASYRWDAAQVLALQAEFAQAVLWEAEEVATFSSWAGTPSGATEKTRERHEVGAGYAGEAAA